MSTQSPVEVADRISRKRAYLLGIAGLVFMVAQVAARPVFAGPAPVSGVRTWLWAVNAIALLLILATGGGLLQRGQVRALVNDEVSARNRSVALAAGFWTAMVIALAIYAVPALRAVSAREAVYLVITASTGLAVLVFGTLELRAHRDA